MFLSLLSENPTRADSICSYVTGIFNTKSNTILRFMFPDNISTVFCTFELPQTYITLIRMLKKY